MPSGGVTIYRLPRKGARLTRVVVRRNGKRVRTTVGISGLLDGSAPTLASALADLADTAFLRAKRRPRAPTRERTRIIRIADLFSGCGLMTLGVVEAARALGYRARPVIAIDTKAEALEIYKKNFPVATTETTDVRDLLRGRISARLSAKERTLKHALGRIDIAVAGPPCQGHSDLNNYTRRHDPKNGLYYRVARFAKVVRPTHIIIENVPAVLHDKGRVVRRTRKALERLGYEVDEGILKMLDLGVPQTRRRHVMVASLRLTLSLDMIVEQHRTRKRTVRWTIGDLRGVRSRSILDTAAHPTMPMIRRIRFLFEHKRYDLPNHKRPACHRGNSHTYKSVYGRLRWSEPAQTITSGFTCMGQGRFVHPSARRTLTLHEAARLQFIPDFFSFSEDIGMTGLAEMIGNAVPPKLTYVIALELLR